jgi:hypothetical protein
MSERKIHPYYDRARDLVDKANELGVIARASKQEAKDAYQTDKKGMDKNRLQKAKEKAEQDEKIFLEAVGLADEAIDDLKYLIFVGRPKNGKYVMGT